jgi:hypothetical protein
MGDGGPGYCIVLTVLASVQSITKSVIHRSRLYVNFRLDLCSGYSKVVYSACVAYEVAVRIARHIADGDGSLTLGLPGSHCFQKSEVPDPASSLFRCPLHRLGSPTSASNCSTTKRRKISRGGSSCGGTKLGPSISPLQEVVNRAHISKRDQFWDQFREAGSGVSFRIGKGSSRQGFRVRLYEKTHTRR